MVTSRSDLALKVITNSSKGVGGELGKVSRNRRRVEAVHSESCQALTPAAPNAFLEWLSPTDGDHGAGLVPVISQSFIDDQRRCDETVRAGVFRGRSVVPRLLRIGVERPLGTCFRTRLIRWRARVLTATSSICRRRMSPRRRASSMAWAWSSMARLPSTITSMSVRRGVVTRTPSMVSTSRAVRRARCSRSTSGVAAMR